jgi:hypothetical protein
VVTAAVPELAAARELRRLVADLGPGVPDVEVVVAVHRAAVRAGNRRWVVWACRTFDAAHAAAR